MTEAGRSVYLAAEDALGLALGRRLLEDAGPIPVFRAEDHQGFGSLRRLTPKFNQLARNGTPVLVLTDLDRHACPSELVTEWMGGLDARPHPRFLLRICIREAEAWVLGDPSHLSGILGITCASLPRDPEALPDPKRTLLDIIRRKAPARIRRRLLPAPGSLAPIGPDYNPILCEFVRTTWNVRQAAMRCPSLARARGRVAELADAIKER